MLGEDTPPRSRSRAAFTIPILVASLIAACLLMVALGRRTDQLRERVVELTRRNRVPRAGLFTPTFTTSTLDGEPVTIGERSDKGRQVLLFFTTTCPYCRASLPIWRELAESTATWSDPKVEVFGIALDSAHRAREYALREQLTFPILTFPSRKLRYLYRATSVPAALVLDHEGRIVYARLGAMTDRLALDSILDAARWRPPARPDVSPPRAQRSASTDRP